MNLRVIWKIQLLYEEDYLQMIKWSLSYLDSFFPTSPHIRYDFLNFPVVPLILAVVRSRFLLKFYLRVNNFSIACYRKLSALTIKTYNIMGPSSQGECSWSPTLSPPYCHSLRTFSFSEYHLLNIPDTNSNPKIPINFCEIIKFFLNHPVMPKGFHIYQIEVSITGHQDFFSQ